MNKRIIVMVVIVISSLSIVSAETTFFEGELRDNFIMAYLDEVGDIGLSGEDLGGITTKSVPPPPSSGGSCPPDYQLIVDKCVKKEIEQQIEVIVVKKPEESFFSEEVVCQTVFKTFRTQVKNEGEINSSSLNVEMIAISIKEEQEIVILAEDLQGYVANFEEKCDSFLPLGISVELGIYKRSHLIILFVISALVGLFIISYIIFKLRKKR